MNITPLMVAAHQQALPATTPNFKSKNELGIPKTAVDRFVSSDMFYKLLVSVDSLPLLYGDLFSSSELPTKAVIIDVNKHKVNKTSKGYTPKVAIIAGAELVRRAKENDKITISCWVGKKAAKALKLKIDKPVTLEAFGTSSVVPGFNMGPRMAPGPAEGSVSAPSATHGDGINFGPPGNMLNHPEWQFLSMQNVEEALSMYISALKDGSWKPVSSQWATVPPSLVNATNEAGIIAKEKGLQAFAPIDFVFYQKCCLNQEIKKKNGLTASKFKKVGDKDDQSTWFEPK